MDEYIVYKHTSPSNKVYIGITRQDPHKRWQSGWGYEDNNYFFNAIRKYGWQNFKHEIICEGLTEEEAKEKEIELIAHYDSTNREKGYNRDLGGSLRTRDSVERSVKAWHENGNADKLRERIKEHWKDEEKAELHRQHLSESLRSEETNAKLSENMKKRYEDPVIKAKQIRLLNEIRGLRTEESYKEAGKKISKHRQEHPEKFVNAGRPRKKVYQMDIETHEIIKVWDSARDASRGIGTSINGVSSAINQGSNLYGYHWEYANGIREKHQRIL